MIRSLQDITVRDLFTTSGSDVWEVESFCEHPTITLRNVRTGEQCGGAVGCRNLRDFVPLKPTEECASNH